MAGSWGTGRLCGHLSSLPRNKPTWPLVDGLAGGHGPRPERILQLPDVALHGFQAFGDGSRGLESRHTRYGDLGMQKELRSQEQARLSSQPSRHQDSGREARPCREAAAPPSHPAPSLGKPSSSPALTAFPPQSLR